MKKLFLKLILALLLNPVILLASTIYTSFHQPANKSVLGLEAEQKEKSSDDPLCVVEEILEVTYADPEGNIQTNIGYQNNKVGLYVYAEILDFSQKAAEIANSNGGDWGYVLVPYNIHDRDETRWGRLFGTLSKKHLIPIIQLWDLKKEDGDGSKVTQGAAAFLNKFAWPIKNRYISVYNEPNDTRFWRTGIDPEDYAQVLNRTIDIFKQCSNNFFLLNGAFNASALTGYGYLDEEEFLQKMNQTVPGIFKKLDGWASHPYPQPNFSGSPFDKGRNSIRAYEWELDTLEHRFGVEKLPVFITETGWAHAEGAEHNPWFLPAEETANYIKQAFEKVWLPDDRIVAVTPFTIKYDPPHDHFSWIDQNKENYPQVDAIKSIEKIAGKPPVRREEVVQVYKCFEK